MTDSVSVYSNVHPNMQNVTDTSVQMVVVDSSVEHATLNNTQRT